MRECATLWGVSETAQEFGRRVRKARERLGLSQGAAAKQAGLSASGWRKIEQAANVGLPERMSIIHLSRVLGWDPDIQLRGLGLEPMRDGEATEEPRDPATELDRLWSSLTAPQRWALVTVAEAMVTPHRWPDGEPAWSADATLRVAYVGTEVVEDRPGATVFEPSGEDLTQRTDEQDSAHRD